MPPKNSNCRPVSKLMTNLHSLNCLFLFLRDGPKKRFYLRKIFPNLWTPPHIHIYQIILGPSLIDHYPVLSCTMFIQYSCMKISVKIQQILVSILFDLMRDQIGPPCVCVFGGKGVFLWGYASSDICFQCKLDTFHIALRIHWCIDSWPY